MEIRFADRDCVARSMGSVVTRRIIARMGVSLRSELVTRALSHLLPVGRAVSTSEFLWRSCGCCVWVYDMSSISQTICEVMEKRKLIVQDFS